MTLYAHEFPYHPHQPAFLLRAVYGEDGRALRIQAVARRLAEQGIGVTGATPHRSRPPCCRHRGPRPTAAIKAGRAFARMAFFVTAGEVHTALPRYSLGA
ncbi:hypothetical protein ACIQNU_42260 [Streptomyces sp. NPDC091292]|uniref:hypothetical protein n=1 Tax=Streptomyces sp. NPDC091292 TaxID=3365991 RepID=UPI0038113D27